MRRGASGINALVCVDKPIGMSSHDVVACVRRAVGERRVGHAGTLDPAASGVLVVGVGQGTRLLGLLSGNDKGYVARISFGSETTTDDAEGEVSCTREVPERLMDAALAQVVVSSMVGSGMQVPPSYSAISVGGKRSYARARAGEEFELEPRPYEVFSAELVSVEGSAEDGSLVWTVSFLVSKGCYIRALARDLGRSMGTAAHLCGLRRTSSGTVSLEQALALKELEEGGAPVLREHLLDPVPSLGLPVRPLSARELESVQNGRRLSPGRDVHGRPLKEGERVSLVADRRLRGVWIVRDGSLCSETNVPEGVEGVH